VLANQLADAHRSSGCKQAAGRPQSARVTINGKAANLSHSGCRALPSVRPRCQHVLGVNVCSVNLRCERPGSQPISKEINMLTANALPGIKALAVLVLLLAACGSDTAIEPSAGTAPPSAVSPSPTPRTQAEGDCSHTVPATVKISDLTLKTEDGLTLRAAAVGSGQRGVILLHQTDNGLCGWLPYAGYLASQGFHVGLFDFRCTFNSGCADGERAYNLTADVAAIATAMRKRGARSLAVVGASYGGAVAIGTCAAVRADACVALSPALYDNKLGGGMTAKKAIGQLRVPLLFAAAPDDSDSPAEENQALLRRARPGIVTAVKLPAGAGHGWDTVTDPNAPERPTSFSGRVIDFITENR
jgi:dienelactone hydrolase